MADATPSSTTSTTETYDVIVVGAGAAGMSAAITAANKGLKTVLIEKSPYWGGSTSRSGGGVWIPNNSVLKRDGVDDTVAKAREYVHAIIGEHAPAEKIDAYIDRGPEALDFLMAHAPLEFEWVKDYSDYYPEAPGGRLAGRSIEPKPFDASRLGADFKTLHPPYSKAPLNMVVLQSDYRWLNVGLRHWRGIARTAKVGGRFFVAKSRKKKLIAMGSALAAELLLGVRQAGVPLRLNTGLTDLLTENGRVVGVVAESNGERVELRARHGVILGSGGFENNPEMRKKYQRDPIGSDWTTGAPSNTGDGITAGLKIGAAVSMMDTYRVRHAVRDVGAALGMPPGEIDAILLNGKTLDLVEVKVGNPLNDSRFGPQVERLAAMLRAHPSVCVLFFLLESKGTTSTPTSPDKLEAGIRKLFSEELKARVKVQFAAGQD